MSSVRILIWFRKKNEEGLFCYQINKPKGHVNITPMEEWEFGIVCERMDIGEVIKGKIDQIQIIKGKP